MRRPAGPPGEPTGLNKERPGERTEARPTGGETIASDAPSWRPHPGDGQAVSTVNTCDKVLYPTEQGAPQGGIISPVLANLTLDGLERVAREAVPRRSLVNVVRYADDFLVTARSPE